MSLTPRIIAEDATFHSFVNGYLREVNAGEWHSRKSWCSLKEKEFPFELNGDWVIELLLPSAELRVAMDVSYHSRVGRHHFSRVYTQSYISGSKWQLADSLYLLIALVREIYQRQLEIADASGQNFAESIKRNETELLARLIDSYQLMTYYFEARADDSALNSPNFIESEQAALSGHWLHPTPKSRQGITFWQQNHYSPELKGQFKLHYFSVAKELVIEGSELPQPTSEILLAELKKYEDVTLAENHVLIPVHPLQAHYLLLQESVRALLDDGRMIYLGEMGTEYTPTSSVRTLFNADSEWMLKFSIPVKITNSLRVNKRDELENGMAVGKYLRKSGFLASRPAFKIVDDPGYISVILPGAESQESGFEVVLRRNLFGKKDGEGICSVLALAQAPHGTGDSLLQQIVQRLAAEERRSLRDVALDWFDAYWSCAVESLIVLYDGYGIALEAHQQNSLLDVSQGYPSCYYYRDNQGFYLSRQYSDTLNEVDDMMTMSDIFYDDDKIISAFSYYVLVNQLFAIIYRLGADGMVAEEVLLERCRVYLGDLKGQMQAVGKAFITEVLENPKLSFKTNLLARVHDIDELREGMEHSVYTTIDNPLFAASIENEIREVFKDSCDAA